MSSNRVVGEPFEGSNTRAVPVIPVDKLGNVITGGGGGGGASGGAASYLSPGNFDVAWTNATTLAVTNLPFPPLQEQIVLVAEFDGDTKIAVYSQDDPAFDFTWTPSADASAGTLVVNTAAFTTGNQFVVQIVGPEPDSLDVTTDFGGPYTHQSPRDFDVAFTTATTLTVGGVTPMAMSPDQADIRAVVEIAAGGAIRMTYTRREWAMTWAAGGAGAGVLTIVGATMQNGSSFIMFVEGPEHNTSAANTARTTATVVKQTQNIGADGNPTPSAADATVPIFTSSLLSGPAAMPIPAGGAGMWSTGQDDFTAVHLSGTSLTLGAFPTALGTPISGDFFLVVETLAAGGRVVHAATDYAMTLAGQVLTVAGAVLVNTSTFDVFCWGPPREYDASTNGKQTVRLNPEKGYGGSNQETSTGLDDNTRHEYWDMRSGGLIYKTWGVGIVDTPGATGSNVYTLHFSTKDDGTAEASANYFDVTLSELGIASMSSAELAANPKLGLWAIDVPQNVKFIRLTQVRTGDAAALDGAYLYDAMWS